MKPVLVLLCFLALAGCKIVFEDEASAVAIPDGPEGDDARNAQRLKATFESELVPLIVSRALDVATLEAALAEDVDAAGEAHANRGAGQGAPWNFAIADSGRVIAANLASSAKTADVDVNGDGAADVRVQLGPVIRGTALRDVAPFYNFDDFRDQIEFAKLARAINDLVRAELHLPDGDITGRTLQFTGVVPVQRAGDALVVTPIVIEVTE